MNIYYLIAFISYFAFFIGLSFYFYRKNATASGFILGNRSVNYWVTAISAQASDMSDWLFMGYPGLIFAMGLFNIWVAIGLTLFMFLNWHFIAPRLRTMTEQYKSLTLASFFQSRFHDTTGTLRLLTVFFTTYFLCYYIAAELIGLGRLFHNVFDVPYNLGIAISIALVVLNIFIGGFKAMAWGDMFRGLFLLVMILIVPVVALSGKVGGMHWFASEFNPAHLAAQLFPDFSLKTLGSIALLAFGWGLGYFGSPHILINFMAIEDPKKLSAAKYIGISWQVLVLAAATVVGSVGIFYFGAGGITHRELVFIELVKHLFHPLFAGFILCAILAATMSVMTAQIMATASMLSEDLFKPILKERMTSRREVTFIRFCIIALPLVAYIIGYNNTSALNDVVSYAWSGLGLAFTPVVIAALYGKRISRIAVTASMLVGGIIGMFWSRCEFTFMPLLPGVILCGAIILVIQSIVRHSTRHATDKVNSI